MPDLHSTDSPVAGIAPLRLEVAALPPDTSVDAAADLFLQADCARMLCLPVVNHEGQVLGTISRHQLNGIFLRRFGRELYGAKPVTALMNASPLVVEEQSSLEEAAGYVTTHLGSPITEDFVVVREGAYRGMGVVMDLLSALQMQVEAGSRQLSDAYRQLQASQAQLVQSEKMASLGQMVAGIAHEINTPLGYVRNNLEMIRDVFEQAGAALRDHGELAAMLLDEQTDEDALGNKIALCQQHLADLDDFAVLNDAHTLFGDSLFGVDTIKELVVNLRNFTRLDQARVAEISLNDCLDQTLTIASNVIRHRVEVIKRYGEIPPVSCSPSQINQVLLNIVTNAAQAIDAPPGKLLLKTEADDHWVRVHLQDNGKGIPPEMQKKIFDPFFTTKPVGQGTGLGLSISFQIIQAHGGTIHVVSEPGRGTKFVVSLPRRTASAPALEEAAHE